MSFRLTIQKALRRSMTLVSPMLNTKVLYRFKFGRPLDLNNPVTLNEKLLWLKFNTYLNNPLVKQGADKYRVREYIEKAGMPEILVPLINVYERPEDIDWESLPDRFVMKINVGCGKNLIVSDKRSLNIKKTEKQLKKWMRDKEWLDYSEMQYKDVRPYIIVEENLCGENGDLPVDYKFYCGSGKCNYVMVCEDREIGKHAKFYYFDKQWNMMPYTQDALDDPHRVVPKPELIDEAFRYAERLSKDFPAVRVDLYIVNNHVYFGELTFTPSGAMDDGRLPSTDRILGDEVVLPIDAMKKRGKN